MSGFPLKLSSAALDAAFPYRLVMGQSLDVLHTGPALTFGGGPSPRRVWELLRVLEPENTAFDGLRAHAGSEAVLQTLDGGLTLSGVVVDDVAQGVVQLLLRRALHHARQDRAALKLISELTDLSGNLENLRTVLRAEAEIVAVDRVGYWIVAEGGLDCVVRYVGRDETYESGESLSAGASPGYLAALRMGKPISWPDLNSDPRTRVLRQEFLTDCESILDVPVKRGAEIIGHIRHEHLFPREFSIQDQIVAMAVAQWIGQRFDRP